MSRVASLGMYDHPAQQAANDQLWTALASILRGKDVPNVPDTLDRSRAVQDIWHDPGLLFGQVCGYPLVSDPTLALQVLGLPIYSAPACIDASHASFIVARISDETGDLEAFRGRRAAINDRGSNSGMNLFRSAVSAVAAGQSFFSSVVQTGSHRESVRAVVLGGADIAAIDVVTYAAFDRFEPEITRGLRIVDRTPNSPTLPFVTSAATNPETVTLLRDALATVIAAPSFAAARSDLFLTGIAPATIDRFLPLLQLERDAALAGYPELC